MKILLFIRISTCIMFCDTRSGYYPVRYDNGYNNGCYLFNPLIEVKDARMYDCPYSPKLDAS